MAVQDYPNGQAPISELVFVENMWLSPDMARRIKYVANYIRERGGTFRGTEGYRWLGNPIDRYVRDERKTTTGGSNQWFQKGREDRGETPSAATPGYSNHGKGLSVDTNTNRMDLRDEAFALVGMRRDISSETWHGTIVGPSRVALPALALETEPEKVTLSGTVTIRRRR